MVVDVCGKVETFLRSKHYKLTNARKEIIRIFNDAGKPLTVQEVHQGLHKITADLASVYRSINLFCEIGILTKIDFQDKLYRYELSDVFVPHHHHLICRQCGHIDNLFDQCLPKGFEERVHQQCGFEVESHILEFYGLCGACAETSSQST